MTSTLVQINAYGQVDPYNDYPPDEGCHLHPKCLECPRETCIFDMKKEYTQVTPQQVVDTYDKVLSIVSKRRLAAEITGDLLNLSWQNVYMLRKKGGAS